MVIRKYTSNPLTYLESTLDTVSPFLQKYGHPIIVAGDPKAKSM